jgi:DNA polymerase III gamma/tau subunit
MKRMLIAIVLIALPAAAADKWWDYYNRGVTAVRAKNYEAGADALQRSLAEMPAESGSARTRNETIVYVPHFWLGIAKFNLGEIDAALREFKTSEEQGAVQSTPYYSQLRDWVSRAQQQKQRNLETAAGDSKREANAAVGRAVSAQMDAVAAGADRTDRYRSAQRKLQEAMETAANGGTNPSSYRRAAETAQQAQSLFAAAADEAKQQKASRPAVVVRKPTPKPQPPPEPQLAVVPAPAPAPPPVLATMIPNKPAEDPTRFQLEAAYRAFASGDLGASEQLLSRILSDRETGEAYLLRGCVRYTRSMLTRQPDMRGATADFRAALKIKPALRLDPAAFSPKLVAFFEQVKKQPSS